MSRTDHTLDSGWYSIDPETGCWNWLRAKTSAGYGTLWSPAIGKVELAHRLSYRIAHNLDAIPTGVVVHHRCENRACVNPDHLELTTRGHNCRIGRKAILTAERARAIRAACAEGRMQKDVAREFGVHRATVQGIIAGRRWSEEG